MLCGPCLPRNHRHPENLDKAASYIKQTFEAAGGRCQEQVFTVFRKQYRNVSAFFGPKGGPRIVVGAHYDAYGSFPVADDNASAVSGLLELAFLLQKEAPHCEVELVVYSLEEPPYFRTEYMGSAQHARALKNHNIQVKAMLCLEMIGYFSDEPGSQKYPISLLGIFYPSKGNFITVVGSLGQIGLTRRIKKTMTEATPLPVWSMNAPGLLPGIDFSDHMNYWDQGFPAVMITDGAFFRNANYHKATDTPETLDYQRMAQVVQGVHEAVKVLVK